MTKPEIKKRLSDLFYTPVDEPKPNPENVRAKNYLLYVTREAIQSWAELTGGNLVVQFLNGEEETFSLEQIKSIYIIDKEDGK